MTKTYRTTKIQWTQYTWNPIRGCTPASEGCINCYAKRMAAWRFAALASNLDKDKEFKPRVIHEKIEEPLKWKKPRMVFVGSMGDIFHEDIPAKDIIHMFDIMQRCKTHTFQVLTKRPERMAEVLFGKEGDWYLGGGDYIKNVWMGVTAENQRMLDYRVHFLATHWAGIRYVSCEPLLEPLNMYDWLEIAKEKGTGKTVFSGWKPAIDWVIVGGETGSSARVCREDWISDIYNQCKDANVPFFFKQPGRKWIPTCIGDQPNQDCENCLGLDCTYGIKRWKERREWPNAAR